MDEAREMYQEHILENYKDPMNFGTIDNPTNKKRELNPLCGDDITIQLIIKENQVKEIKFKGESDDNINKICCIITSLCFYVFGKLLILKFENRFLVCKTFSVYIYTYIYI